MKAKSLITMLSLVFLLAGGITGMLFAGFGLSKVTGAVYTMSNDPGGNEILVFNRYADGSLAFSGAYATGGLGTGAGLGNQRGLVMSDNQQWLLAVNAGSDEVSVFRIQKNRLALTDTAASGGVMPVSVAIHKDRVYVLHAGGSVGDIDVVTGFTLNKRGRLEADPQATLLLSADMTAPAQVAFSPDGNYLMVTEKATNLIDTYVLNPDGTTGMPIVNLSAGETPFGFSFGKRNQVFVSEAFGAATDAGAVSSYRIRRDGTLEVLDPSVPNTETAPCWLAVTKDGRTAYTTNTPSDSLSGYEIDFDGMLTLLDADGRTGEPGAGTGPIDMDFSGNERFLYTLNSGNGTIGAFEVKKNGSLTHLHNTPGLPPGANGLAAR